MSANNTRYGVGSLQNDSGNNNAAFGAYSLYTTLDTSNNTAVGSNSLLYTTSGGNNTAIGAGSICNNTTGSLNTAVGSSSLEGSLDPSGNPRSVGTQNVAVGVQSLFSNRGNLNTALGAYAGLSPVDGSNNTFLGCNTDVSDNTLIYNNSTALGYNATIDASYQIVLGTTNERTLIPGNNVSIAYNPYTYNSPADYYETGTNSLDVSGNVNIYKGTLYVSSINDEPIASQTLVQTLVNGNSAGYKDITDVSNIDVQSINGVPVFGRQLTFIDLSNQPFTVTNTNEQTIVPSIPLTQGGYLTTSQIVFSTSAGITSISLRLYLGATLIRSLTQSGTGITGGVLSIPTLPVDVTDASNNLSLRFSAIAPNPTTITVLGPSQSYVLVNNVYVGGLPTPVPSQYIWSELTAAISPYDGITSSADGTRLAVSGFNVPIRYSLNSGTTWLNATNSGSRDWEDITSDASGVRVYSCVWGGGIWRSIDSGATWTNPDTTTGNWMGIATSDNGLSVFAGRSNGIGRRSLDGGATWFNIGVNFNIGSIACDASGVNLVACGPGVTGVNSSIRTSPDSGVTWVDRVATSGTRRFMNVASSSNGQILVATVQNGNIFRSVNGGAAWTELTSAGSRAWSGISTSNDGTIINAQVRTGFIFTSRDSGVTWTEQTSAGSRAWGWYGIANNATGTSIVACVNNGFVYRAIFI